MDENKDKIKDRKIVDVRKELWDRSEEIIQDIKEYRVCIQNALNDVSIQDLVNNMQNTTNVSDSLVKWENDVCEFLDALYSFEVEENHENG